MCNLDKRAWIAFQAEVSDKELLRALGGEEVVGLLDETRLRSGFYEYGDILFALIVGHWDSVSEGRLETASDLFINLIMQSREMAVDVIILLLCVSIP